MSFLKSKFRHPKLPRNDLGLTQQAYEGPLSTLCAGCGHDAIGASIIQACHELSIPPHRIAKLSGIGCSSKAPTYFLDKAHGFNSVHGRMPSIVTGANMANRDLVYIGMSGDGDTSAIGMGQFAHVVRRRLNMLYLVANNGVYGLTKGQTSATADEGSLSKQGQANPLEGIDLVTMAIQLGATFVARSFSGDKRELLPLIKAGLSHNGFAFIDIVSPCVTFNNHAGSTKSYDYVRDHVTTGAVTDFVPVEEEIIVSSSDSEAQDICLHDGSILRLQKTGNEYDPQDRQQALAAIEQSRQQDRILTGLLYVDPAAQDLHEVLGTTDKPLNSLGERALCPGSDVLEVINDSFR
ncbi:2-oxoacid:ferredoxin oxidoreductase subunit beta [Motiliproteus coralliicola]|uniref:2-oxoacid:ferredoxin oxidoreductase subunit beta n=1 Tax=Motiliproteus coralliicola TaxID=2283196 RepID=A0A369WBS1_9GAMM|nr:2-oxoacid:ferredoxin oxidoreductase subunit beta [Motiliproteus coralliicola]RDE19460.1 2-oxoacid:ferredoxin oxidoreductase subunit beta [Motiliproteus coralliicola]